MRRFWVEQLDLEVGQSLEISGDEFKHICVVCRMQQGAKFEILNAQGMAFFSRLTTVGKKSAVVELLEAREISVPQKPWLRLYVSVPKFSTFELILEKSVELGVKSIHPFFSDFSFIKSAEKITSSKLKRWQKIITSASRQTGRGDLMELCEPIGLKECLVLINQSPAVLGLFPFEGEAATALPFSQALAAWNPDKHKEICCFVGSEGGFSREEVEYFQEYGFQPSTLGDQVLRVETACLAIASIIKYHTGQLS